ncbi:flavodoxin family protein [Anaerosporobacter faecicola]|uniref:flavodoxin family protein n=1 Tax=Anaerosporobacter faecicola TaxID=2718714 RepID=UPI0014389507|nr:flavodoxin family protein [Anaerosporobacter faecicola]
MKILLINGSPRKKGATATILNELYKNLINQPNVDAEIIHISDLSLHFCMGCCACYKTGTCIYSDEIESLSQRIAHADGLIIGSPTYASNVSAQLKLLFDRGHFIMEQLLDNKYAMSVATYENYGGKSTSKIINNLLLFSGAKISGTIISKSEFNANPTTRKAFRKQLLKKSNKLYHDIVKRRKHPLQHILHKFIFELGIKPFVKRKGYEAVIQQWNQNNRNSIYK